MTAPATSIAARNPYLPQPPEDGQHEYRAAGYRCALCGAYQGSDEGKAPCRGEFRESGKMRAWAREKWEADLLQRYTHLTPADLRLIEQHGRNLVNTGAGVWPSSREHILDLVNDFRRPNNRDLSVNLPRYLLGYGITCQLSFVARMTSA